MSQQHSQVLVESKKSLCELKLKIKNWELKYFENNGSKPSKIDIDKESDFIKELYRQYWKLKKTEEKNVQASKKLPECSSWGQELNKSIMGCKNPQKGETDVLVSFSEKLKNQAVKSGAFAKVFRPINPIFKISVSDSQIQPSSVQQNEDKVKFSSNSEQLSNHAFVDEKELLDDSDENWQSFTNTAQHSRKLKVIKPSARLKNVARSVNSLSSLSTSLSNRKTSFQSKINHDWLERCTSLAMPEISSVVEPVNAISEDLARSSKEIESDQTFLKEGVSPNSCRTSLSDNLSKNYAGNSISLHNNTNDLMINFKNLCHTLKKPVEVDVCVMNKSDLVQPSAITSEHFEPPLSNSVGRECHRQQANESFVLSQDRKDICIQDEVPVKRKKRKLNEVSEIDQSTSKRRYSPDLSQASYAPKKSLGSANDNYVRINMKKKKFSRGHHHINVRKMKWKKWKQLKKSSGDSSIIASSNVASSACFKCGQVGHWARNCKVESVSHKDLLPNDDDFIESLLPTIEEAAEVARNSSIKHSVRLHKDTSTGLVPSICNIQENCDVLPVLAAPEIDIASQNAKVTALFDLTHGGKVMDTPLEVMDALKKFGYSEFRTGQEKVIMRILSGLSTLVVLPTGSGKSLCYQLPAYLYAQRYSCISLIVSPLVSLMEDQVTGLPSFLQAVCLHSAMSDSQKEAALCTISRGKAQILLVSPEAVIGGRLFGNKFWSTNLPPVAFACIDEAHCLSEWSHNFRPSYLQLYKVMTKKLGIKCILGLTATATQVASSHIAHHLELKDLEESVVGRTNVPSNLQITVSRDKDKDWALIELLKEERFQNCDSLLIYCIRREETERVATLIRTSLQGDFTTSETNALKYSISKKAKKSQGKYFVWSAEAYHAGLSICKRRSVQKKFMTGKIRVVVATVAFGMGLDKSDVRAVIHFNMPKSFESYVQEIGRAGRDGLPALCHLFLNSEKSDLWELQRHIYSNSIDRRVVRKLLQKIFLPCKCVKTGNGIEQLSENENKMDNKKNREVCIKHERAFSIEKTVQELDIKEENVSTLLCYLEHHPKQWVEILPPAYSVCTIRCYGGSQQMRRLIQKCPPIAAAIALDEKMGKNWVNSNQYQFPVIEVSSHMSWDSGSVKRQLKQLEWGKKQTDGQNRKTGILVEFSGLSFHLMARGNLDDDELDAVLDFLFERVRKQEESELKRLHYMFSTFLSFSFSNHWSCNGEASIKRNDAIKEKINQYFEGGQFEVDTSAFQSYNTTLANEIALDDIRQCVRNLIHTHHDHNFTGRAIARILHGISSPCYPAEIWGRVHKFWRSHLNNDFNLVLKIANEEILKLK